MAYVFWLLKLEGCPLLCRMARGKKAAAPAPPMNPNLVNSFLAKARAVVSSVQGDKRKVDEVGGNEVPEPPSTKPKSIPSPPPSLTAAVVAKSPSEATPSVQPVPPPLRVRGKSPHEMAQPAQPAAKSKALSLTAVPLPKNPPTQVPPVPVQTHPSSGRDGDVPSPELVTPPPKVSAHASPPITPTDPVKELSYAEHSEEDPRWDQGHSQHEYFTSKYGEKWWNDRSWDYGYGSWRNDRHVWGSSYDWSNPDWSQDFSRMWSNNSVEQDQEAEAQSSTGTNTEGVREALAHRKPTIHSPASFESVPPTPVPATPKEAEPTGDVVSEAPTGAVADQEVDAEVEDEKQTWPPVDKHGNALTKAALYMRFYRGLRSTLSLIDFLGSRVNQLWVVTLRFGGKWFKVCFE